MSSRVLLKTLQQHIADALKTADLRKARGQIFTKELQPRVLAWVGLNHAVDEGVIEINPVVGVRHQELEEQLAALLGERSDGLVPPTAAANVGYIKSGRYRGFTFGPTTIDQDTVEELAGDVIGPGLSWARHNADASALIETLRSSALLNPEQTSYRLPTALWMVGLHDEARAMIEGRVRGLVGRQDAAAHRYTRFANELLRRL